MLKNLQALPKLRPLFFAALFALGFGLAAELPDSPQDALIIVPSRPAAPIDPVRWYRSNGAGMTLEEIHSPMLALRSEYAVSVEMMNPALLPGTLPPVLRSYYNDSFRVELKRLYESGDEVRRQWVFRDSQGTNRIIAAGSGPLFGFEVLIAETLVSTPEIIIDEYEEEREEEEESEPSSEPEAEGEPEPEGEPEEPKSSGFIEIRNAQGSLMRELQYNEDLSEWDFRFTYRDGILIRTESWFKEAPTPPPPPPVSLFELLRDELEEGDEPENEDEEDAPPPPPPPPPVLEIREPVLSRMFTDVFRYTRSGSIRAIDRTIHEAAAAISRISFPGIGPRITSPDEELPIEGGTYTGEYFGGEQLLEGMTINYSLDTRGRVLTEIWRDENNAVIGELTNSWVGDRLQSVTWISGGDEQRVEFDYDREGHRIAERNLRNGVLERSVTHEDGRDLEEIYINGRLVLRAIWQDGVRLSEERVR